MPLPKRVFGHGFVLNKGEKMSKSVGNVVDPFDLVKAYGRDQLRYFFLREVMFGQDGNYTPEAIANRINADLANNLGNLAQRSLSMIFKNCDGKIPTPGAFTAEDKAILRQGRRPVRDRAHRDGPAGDHQISRCRLERRSPTPTAISRPKSRGRKRRPIRSGWTTILYVTAEVVRQFAILAQPAMPDACASCSTLLAVPAAARTFAVARRKPAASYAGTPIPEPQGVFPRYVDPAAEADKPAAHRPRRKPIAKAAKEAKRAAEREKQQNANKDKTS